MSLKHGLHSGSTWLQQIASLAKDALPSYFEEGPLKSVISEFARLGGATGALFKLASLAIPEPTPEELITQQLCSRFIDVFQELLQNAIDNDELKASDWFDLSRREIIKIVEAELALEFTWLSVLSSDGPSPARSWPLVNELSDIGAFWLRGLLLKQSCSRQHAQLQSDKARGVLFDALACQVDLLRSDPRIVKAVSTSKHKLARGGFDQLGEKLALLNNYRIFGEAAQSRIYVKPDLTFTQSKSGEISELPTSQESICEYLLSKFPQMAVVQGEMGAGKSCLLRSITSQLANTYLNNKKYPVIYVSWRKIFDNHDLYGAIASLLRHEHGITLGDLQSREPKMFVIDGFDEMNCHDANAMLVHFRRIYRLIEDGNSVLLAIRSTAISMGLRSFLNNEAIPIITIKQFNVELVTKCIKNWCDYWYCNTETYRDCSSLYIDHERVVQQLDYVSNNSPTKTYNPLLVFMFVKYFDDGTVLTDSMPKKSGVFRLFVDKTIRGKLATSGEYFPIDFDEYRYRHILQEIAYVASTRINSRDCPVEALVAHTQPELLVNLRFSDLRTAFILHFFRASDEVDSEFRFYPEGFRHYLLAEWCIAALLRSFVSSTNEYIVALARLKLDNTERDLIDELFFWLGKLVDTHQETECKIVLRTYGVNIGNTTSQKFLLRFNAWLKNIICNFDIRMLLGGRASLSSELPLREIIGEIHTIQDVAILGLIGIYRGMSLDPGDSPIFAKQEEHRSLADVIRLGYITRGYNREAPYDLRELGLQDIDLSGLGLYEARLAGSNLKSSTLSSALLSRADCTNTVLNNANFEYANLMYSQFEGADISEAMFKGANLTGTRLNESADNERTNDCEMSNTNVVIPQEVVLGNGRVLHFKHSPIVLKIGYRLVHLVDEKQGGDLLTHISTVRKCMYERLGFYIPPVHIQDDMSLEDPSSFYFILNDRKVAQAKVVLNHFFVPRDIAHSDRIQGIECGHAGDWLWGIWCNDKARRIAAENNVITLTPSQAITSVLECIIQEHAHDMISCSEIYMLLYDFAKVNDKLVEEMVRGSNALLTIHELQIILQNLVQEHISIIDFEKVLTRLRFVFDTTQNLDELSELVRAELKDRVSHLCTKGLEGGQSSIIKYCEFPVEVQEMVRNATKRSQYHLRLDWTPKDEYRAWSMVHQLLNGLVENNYTGVLLTDPDVRLQTFRWLSSRGSKIRVVSRREIADGYVLEPYK